jgi:TonB dependent receptor
MFRSEGLDIVSGAGHLATERKEVETTEFLGLAPPSLTVDESDIRYTNLYVYSQIKYLKSLTLTLGASVDFLQEDIVQRNQVNPKLGLTWNPLPRTTIRAAAFRALDRPLISDRTIEPTQVAGFNQFFRTAFAFSARDVFPGTDVWRYGIGIDHKVSTDLYAGAEFSKRDSKVSGELETPTATEIRQVDWNENLARTYLYWTPRPWLASSAEYQFERFKRDRLFGGVATGIVEADTHRLALGINLFHHSGFGARLKATYIDQEGTFGPKVFQGSFFPGADHFWVVDAAIRYRLPKRWGFITFGVKNLFAEDFKFQETDPANPLIQPDRLIFGRFTLMF